MAKHHVYTFDEIKREFECRGYTLITDHKLKYREKYEYICNKHADEGSQFIDWGHFHSGHRGCYYCGREIVESSRRKDLSEFHAKELAESKGFVYVDTIRRDGKIYVQFICPKHKEYGVQEMWYFNMKRDISGCQHCIGRNDSDEHILRDMFNANPYIKPLEPICGRTKSIRMFCTKHNIETHTTPNNIIDGQGCYYCGLEKLSEASKISQDEFIKRLSDTHSNIELIGGYDGITSIITVRCNICDNIWSGIANNIWHTGCATCNSNTTESKVGDILNKYNISYTRQYMFDDCRDIRPLPFDYYLQDYNVLIEYDGEGHYMPVNFGGISDEDAQKHLEYVKAHDELKTQYCIEHCIPLIRIPYFEKNNLEKCLLESLKQYVYIDDKAINN